MTWYENKFLLGHLIASVSAKNLHCKVLTVKVIFSYFQSESNPVFTVLIGNVHLIAST